MFKKVISAVIAAVIFMPAVVFSLGGGTTSADFLKIGMGARPSAMGEAYSAAGDDSDAAFWNPAGIAQIGRYHFTLMHLVWYAGANYDYFSGVMAIDSSSSAGISVNAFWIPPYDSTQDDAYGNFEEGLTSSYYDLAVRATYAKILGNVYTNDFTIGNIAFGASVSYIQRQILDYSYPAMFTLDMGLIANLTKNMKTALVVKNIGNNTGEDPTPLNMTAGFAYDLDINSDFGTKFALDIVKPFDLTNPEYAKWFFNIGFEAKIIDMVYLRLGHKIGRADENFTAGLGVSVPDVAAIDYAFAPHTELGASHRVSVSFSFGEDVERPDIGAPRPPQNIKAAAGDKMVSIGWDPNPEANISGYNIYYKRTGVENRFSKLNDKPIKEESRFKAVLENGVEYEFTVTAINNRGLESIRSKTVRATPDEYTAEKPAKVRGINARQSDSGIVVSWNESRDDAVIGYNLYYKQESDEKFRKLNRTILKRTRATLAGLKKGVTYNFMATAVSKDSVESDFSEVIEAEMK